MLGTAVCNYSGLLGKLDLVLTVTNYSLFSVECFIKAVNITSIKLQQQAGRWNVTQTWNLMYSALSALEMSSLMGQIQRKGNMHKQV